MNCDFLFNICLWLIRVSIITTGYAALGLSHSPFAMAKPTGKGQTMNDRSHGLPLSHNEQHHRRRNPDTSVLKRYLTLPPQVSVLIGDPLLGHRHSIDVPLTPDMTVLRALITAVDSNKNISSPYNVQLQWDETLGCYNIYRALGLSNTESDKWIIQIRNGNQQVIYRNRCLPLQSVILRPFYEVHIMYQRGRN